MAFFDFIRKKYSLAGADVLRGRTDCHTHILFGVDDGVSTLDESIAILSFEESLGVSDVWCTPHVMEDIPNATERLRQRFAELEQAYEGPVRLHLAAEYMLDNLFEERFADGDILIMGEDSVLVETSTWNPPPGLYETLSNIQRAGYHPLLAHPERYRYLSAADYEKLSKMGVHMQLNLGSLVGYYGDTAKNKAIYLLEKGWYNEIGTDCHRLRSLQEQLKHETLTKDKLALLSF